MKVIAVDFDGTLAHYEGYKGVGVYGEAVPSMLKRVRNWLAEGHKVVIFTSRVEDSANSDDEGVWFQEFCGISHWLKKHKLPELEITCIKSKSFTEIWDDRAVTVERNTGRILNSMPNK